MGEHASVVTSVEGTLMCSLCGCEWAEHLPFAVDQETPIEGCIQALGRRLAELDARTSGIDRLS